MKKNSFTALFAHLPQDAINFDELSTHNVVIAIKTRLKAIGNKVVGNIKLVVTNNIITYIRYAFNLKKYFN